MKKIIKATSGFILSLVLFLISPIQILAEEPAEAPKELYKEITISAAGDCTLGIDANFNYGSSLPAKYNEVGDPAYFLEGVSSVFSQDDLTIVNMEGTLTTQGVRADKTYAFRGDPEYVNILTSGSVEACTLANNHSKDYGEVSFADTVNYLENAGVHTFDENRYNIVDVKGIKVGLIGIYELPYGLGCKDNLISQLRSIRADGADVIVVSFHWGIERDYVPGNVQIELAHAAIDNGADLVLGHHPHVLQGIELYKGKYICYSLGNFCFGGNSNPGDKDTMIFQQTFKFFGNRLIEESKPEGLLADDWISPRSQISNLFEELTYDGCTIVPCSLSSQTYTNDYRPRILEGEDANRLMERLRGFSANLSSKYR